MHSFHDHHHQHRRRLQVAMHCIEAARRGSHGHRFAHFSDEAEMFGDGPRRGRRFDGGDLRLLILHLLETEQRHGYDLIKAIETLSEGAYSPSPGVIYPALTWLEEAGFAAGSTEANRKLYAITEEGKAHLDEHRDELEAIIARLHHFARHHRDARERWERKIVRIRKHLGDEVSEDIDIDIPGVIPEVNRARKALKAAIRAAIAEGEEAQKRLAGILERAAAEIGPGDIDLG